LIKIITALQIGYLTVAVNIFRSAYMNTNEVTCLA